METAEFLLFLLLITISAENHAPPPLKGIKLLKHSKIGIFKVKDTHFQSHL